MSTNRTALAIALAALLPASTRLVADDGARPVAAPTVDDLVGAILFGPASELPRAAGWLRALPEEQVEAVLLRLRRAALPATSTRSAGRVEGSVAGDAVAGRPRTVELRRRGLDAAGALRSLLGRDGPAPSAVDARGRYAIVDVPPGRYDVALVDGPTTYVFADALVTNDEVVRRDLALDRTAVEFRRPAPAAGDAANVTIVGVRRDPPAATCEVAAAATVRATGLARGAWAFTPTLDLVTGDVVVVELRPDVPAHAEVVLPPHGWIVAQAPPATAGGAHVVAVEAADGTRTAFRSADAAGVARIATPPGRWRVRLAPRGTAREVEVRPGERVPVSLPE